MRLNRTEHEERLADAEGTAFLLAHSDDAPLPNGGTMRKPATWVEMDEAQRVRYCYGADRRPSGQASRTLPLSAMPTTDGATSYVPGDRSIRSAIARRIMARVVQAQGDALTRRIVRVLCEPAGPLGRFSLTGARSPDTARRFRRGQTKGLAILGRYAQNRLGIQGRAQGGRVAPKVAKRIRALVGWGDSLPGALAFHAFHDAAMDAEHGARDALQSGALVALSCHRSRVRTFGGA